MRSQTTINESSEKLSMSMSECVEATVESDGEKRKCEKRKASVSIF